MLYYIYRKGNQEDRHKEALLWRRNRNVPVKRKQQLCAPP